MSRPAFSADRRAVTPLVGVIIILGLAVAVAGIIGVTIASIPADVATPPDATAQYNQTGDDVTITITSVSTTTESLTIRTSNPSTASPPPTLQPTPDSSVTVPITPGDTVTVTANDGDTQQLAGRYTANDFDPASTDPHSNAPPSPSAVLTTMEQDASGRYKIKNDHHLQAIAADPDADYILTTGINATETHSWNNGKGFQPITGFSGSLDGNGHTIRGLTINRPGTNGVGLIASTTSPSSTTTIVTNLTLYDIDITGGSQTGAIAGTADGSLTNITVTGRVDGDTNVGLIAGRTTGSIQQAHTAGTVDGTTNVGGLTGTSEHDITNATTTATVTGDTRVGGLTGQYLDGTGPFDTATLDRSAARGSVTGNDAVGGITGTNDAAIERVYTTATLSSSGSIGGITATDQSDDGTLETSDIADSAYYDTQATGVTNSDGGTSRSTSEMTGDTATSSMPELDYTDIWSPMYNDYPVLTTQPD